MSGGNACQNTSVVFDPAFTAYDFGPDHPMAPVRVDLTMRLAEALGVTGEDALRVVGAEPATDELIGTVHAQHLIDAVRRLGEDPSGTDLEHGLGSEDTPVFAGMHEAGARVVGASIEAARRVWTGQDLHSANLMGGLHHAMAGKASGFCVYNDIAVAVRWLLDNGAQRVAYVDIDVHHGDGVERIFWDDPRVLTISLHETGEALFPGTGAVSDLGGPQARGSAVNIPLPATTGDGGWLRAFHAVVPQVLRAFQPDILVTQHGCDSHMDDPLSHMMLTIDGQRAAHQALHDVAHEVTDGKWVATGGGGYALVDVVPRSWTHLLAIVGGRPLDPGLETPTSWRDHVRLSLGVQAPFRMTDGRDPGFRDWSEGINPEHPLDRTIKAVRDAVFPLHGLDPWVDTW
ncbi:acetoin utilization protein AcuC [Nocardioides daedukensis]|uniref:Acetoin utilization protein AcuC n=1 Tax=Nocardioides daedukensis TaxID=634462 RepID=A0A7Y9S379_9ACTN|nr:acetoin utilization protein AcuC [Nocardioides daedukensis]NYG58899.1 acetoin utilization protein AcuC [Nocardioides daedukensis]